ncbi:type VI secretion system protein TssA [Serratia microhaemolytica]|uniref:type VI secretion system protein TssA n=1 Tax=Serratia microhaemolytica TaxID=2675110 RepID=UPI000FDEC06F|nr:type VI secretion system protein TssA [Serratia microhaemolytica]
MASLTSLIAACDSTPEALLQQAIQQLADWQHWLSPVNESSSVGEDPTYHDDFQLIREEVSKLSGADTTLICQLTEQLLVSYCKDLRVATYYIWARLHREGAEGLASGLLLLAGLLHQFGEQLHPPRALSRKSALEWLVSERMLDSLRLYPIVTKQQLLQILRALALIEHVLATWPSASQPQLTALYQMLETRLTTTRDANNSSASAGTASAGSGLEDSMLENNMLKNSVLENSMLGNSVLENSVLEKYAPPPQLHNVQSGRDLFEQANILSRYLREQPNGQLAAHHLIKNLRWDTLHGLPPFNSTHCTRLTPPRAEYRSQLKRLYLQQSWLELYEQTENMFNEAANHFWLDLQWYLHQAFSKAGSPFDSWADYIKQDLKLLLTRLPGLETLCWNDGTPFADEVTLAWINQQVLEPTAASWNTANNTPLSYQDDDPQQWEAEAVNLADQQGVESAITWLQTRPGVSSVRQQWLLRLVIARVSEQYNQHDMALHLLTELDSAGQNLRLTQWQPTLLFEVKARRLTLLRSKLQRSDSDKIRLSGEIEQLLGELIVLDPARAMVLCH